MNRTPENLEIPTEADMLELGGRLAATLNPGQVVALSGELGVGKTTLVRGILRGMGFAGRVKSPSYGLVESYELPGLIVHHLDLYRLADPEELDYLGLEDLVGDESLVLIEWPEHGTGRLPPLTGKIHIEATGELRRVQFSGI